MLLCFGVFLARGRGTPFVLDPPKEFVMSSELEHAIKRYTQWLGSYKVSGELKRIKVWLTVNGGRIEFLTRADSYKVKRVRRNPRVVCFVGGQNGPAIAGTAEIITDEDAMWRVYRAYWKTHPVVMIFIAGGISKRIKTGQQVLIRVHPDEPNPLADLTDPAV